VILLIFGWHTLYQTKYAEICRIKIKVNVSPMNKTIPLRKRSEQLTGDEDGKGQRE
jgi:hypothetical protein